MKKGTQLRWLEFNLAILLTPGFAAVAPYRASAATENWPQFRGPNCSGVAEKAKPPVTIGTNQGVIWKVEVPWSPSSPCVSGDSIFLTTFSDGELQTRGYSRRNGKLLWTGGVKPD